MAELIQATQDTAKIFNEMLTHDKVVLCGDSLIFVNVLRKEKQLCEWAVQEFGALVEDIRNVWAKKTVTKSMTPVGEITLESTQFLKEEPIISADFTHILAFRSTDMNLLKYIEFEVNKRYDQRKRLSQDFELEGNTKQPKLKSLAEKDVDNYVKQLFADVKVN